MPGLNREDFIGKMLGNSQNCQIDWRIGHGKRTGTKRVLDNSHRQTSTWDRLAGIFLLLWWDKKGQCWSWVMSQVQALGTMFGYHLGKSKASLKQNSFLTQLVH